MSKKFPVAIHVAFSSDVYLDFSAGNVVRLTLAGSSTCLDRAEARAVAEALLDWAGRNPVAPCDEGEVYVAYSADLPLRTRGNAEEYANAVLRGLRGLSSEPVRYHVARVVKRFTRTATLTEEDI